MKKFIILVIALASLGALTLGIVLAQTDTPETPVFPGDHYGMMGGRSAGGGNMQEYMHEAFAEALGISEEEFESRMLAGESLWAIATSLGFDADAVADLHNQARLEALELAYANGALSDEQYQWMQERMSENDGYGMGGGYGMHGGGFGRGQGGGFGLHGDCPNYVEPATP